MSKWVHKVLIFFHFLLFPVMVVAGVETYYDYKKVELDSCGGKVRFSVRGTNYDPDINGEFVRAAPYELLLVYESENDFEKLYLQDLNIKHLDDAGVFQLENSVTTSEFYKGKYISVAIFTGRAAGIDKKYVDIELSARLGFSGKSEEYCKIKFIVERNYKRIRVWDFWQRIMSI